MQSLVDEEEKLDERHEVFKRVFSTLDGKKMLRYMFADSGFFEAAGTEDASLLLEGRRGWMLEILNTIAIDPIEMSIAEMDDGTDSFLDEVLNAKKEA